MTKNVLQICSSLHGQASHSSNISDKVSARLLESADGAALKRRDLSADPIPHLDLRVFETFADSSAAVTPGQVSGHALSDLLISELVEADVLVLGAPMHNLMIPSTLKSWIDYVTRAGKTFQFTDAGPVGLLKNEAAYIVIAQGGDFLGTEGDFVTGYLKATLQTIGIVQTEFIYVSGLALGTERAKAGLLAAEERVAELFPV